MIDCKHPSSELFMYAVSQDGYLLKFQFSSHFKKTSILECVSVCVCTHAHLPTLTHTVMSNSYFGTSVSLYCFLLHFSSETEGGVITSPSLTWEVQCPLQELGHQFSLVQSLSRVRLCDPMDCSAPGLPVHHQFQESTQTHVDRVGDAIQPSHNLLSPSPPAFHLS